MFSPSKAAAIGASPTMIRAWVETPGTVCAVTGKTAAVRRHSARTPLIQLRCPDRILLSAILHPPPHATDNNRRETAHCYRRKRMGDRLRSAIGGNRRIFSRLSVHARQFRGNEKNADQKRHFWTFRSAFKSEFSRLARIS